MHNRISGALLMLAMAAHPIAPQSVRLGCDFVRPATSAMQKASTALQASPRWGSTLDRLSAALNVLQDTRAR